ncbi:MAG: GNAT family N-acetyltransferase [Methanomassiliicoccales archaeon]|jgi:GNAT superfamily N-acetyltransferase
MDVTIVKVDDKNADLLAGLIKELARFEHLEPPTQEAISRLKRDLSSEHPYLVAQLAMAEGKPIGYACYYFTYSTFLARPTLFLEDIFVLDPYRRNGVGSKRLEFCVAEAQRKECGRMEWNVLDWNVEAISFYERTGARILKEWRVVRLKSEDFGQFLEQRKKKSS